MSEATATAPDLIGHLWLRKGGLVLSNGRVITAIAVPVDNREEVLPIYRQDGRIVIELGICSMDFSS